MIAFVDINDTCRAAAAAVLYQAATGQPAAHVGVFAEEGIRPGSIVQTAAAECGIALQAVTSVALTAELLEKADRVVAVTAAIAARMREDYPDCAHKIGSMEVPDPFGMGKQAYLDCFESLRQQVEALE